MGVCRLALASLTAGLALNACALSIEGLQGDSVAGSTDGALVETGVPPDDATMSVANEGAASDVGVDDVAQGDGGGVGPPGDDAGILGVDAGNGGDADHASDAAGCDADLTSDPGHCGRCDRDCAGGTCRAGSCTPVGIVASQDPIRALGVSDTVLVWVTDQPQIFRAALDGSAQQPILTPSASVSELVVAGPSIFYTTGDLHRVSVDGTGDTIVASGRADACLQVSGALVYVVNGSTPPLSIDVVDLDAGSRATLVPTQDLLMPWGVAVTPTDVYWSGNQHLNPDGGIWRLSRSGGTPTEIVPHLANPNCLTIYDGALFWPNSDNGTIMTSALDGRGASVLASGQSLTNPPTTVAVDARFVYWQSGTSILRLAR
jgi:hypothetical protein